MTKPKTLEDVAALFRAAGNCTAMSGWWKHARLCRIGRTTGARGTRWFEKGDITVAFVRPDGITAWSWLPALPWMPEGKQGTVAWCHLAAGVPVRFL